ncbi:MBL fold metallo-hydrolase [Miltoncostaea marina]|uniref:MBL fold metallo-hydrolase n=1 Tax=Miltoncostaea marina TaxID=2843215 RepID=UPI001C3D0869|nr:MBL fold metallo-hydrolase [Miltoncostaea marina]
MAIRSYGAAGTVTGSCHLVEADGRRLLVDCGAFQGSRELFARNRGPLGFDPASLDGVLVTHAHLDHSGRLPLLLRGGYAGPVHALPATRELCEHLLLDAAKIQREDAERDRRNGREADPATFDDDDVWRTLARFEPLAYDVAAEVGGLRVTARRAGHIPGSASFLIEAAGRRLVVSGDIGNARKEILPDPAPCPPADVVVMESTYGDRDHRPYEDTIEELARVLREAWERGGMILVPSFALERAHEVLYTVAGLERSHDIPSMPVYVDSPLAAKVDEVYDRFPEELSDELRLVVATGRNPFEPKHLRYTRSVQESRRIAEAGGPAIVIAGSGMLSGGRILHHLRAHAGSPDTTVLIVGYQPSGGLGRALIDGHETVRIMGRETRVRARTVTVGGLSAHAGRTELLDWVRSSGDAEVRLVHGEPGALESLRDALAAAGRRAVVQPSEVPVPGDGRHHEAGE